MRKPVTLIIMTCLVVYHSNGRPHPEVDCVAAPYTAWSLVRHGSLDVGAYPDLDRLLGAPIRELPDGSRVSIRPPGGALAVVPFVAPFALVREAPLSETHMTHLGKLAAAVSVAVGAALLFLVCRRLAPAAAWPATILFAFGTCLWSVASQAIWMHGPATLWLCVALYGLARADARPGRWCALVGLALGLAVLTRPTTAFFVLATGGALLAQRQWRGVLGLALGGALPLACLVALNWAQFGDPIRGGYADDNWQDAPPLWLGLGGLLVAPSRGLLVYSPALVLAPLGAYWLARRGGAGGLLRGQLLAWTAGAAVTLWFYARWYDWRGGWCYGPRFLCETLPVLCLLFAVAYDRLRAPRWRRGAAGLVALSVLVHFVGIFGYSGYADWQDRHALPDQGRCLFAVYDTQIEAHTLALVRKITAAVTG